MRPDVAVVILNYNGVKYLEQFLAGVCLYSESARVVVADNASTDESVSYLRKEFPQVEIIELSQNYGFSKGYNEALKRIQAQYYVLLNSDVEVSPHWLAPIIDLMDKDKRVGAAQPKVLAFHQKKHFEYAGAAGGYLDKLGYPYCRGRIFDFCEEDKGQYNNIADVFWATGACLFVRADLYHQLGGLDDDFFAHMEEIDFCWRLKNAGYRLLCVPQSHVFHVGGGTLNKTNPRKTFLNFRNNLMMLHKNLPSHLIFILIFLRLLLDGLAGIKFVVSGQFSHCWAIVNAHFAYYGYLPNLARKRKALKKLKKTEAYTDTTPSSILWHYFVRGRKQFSDLLK